MRTTFFNGVLTLGLAFTCFGCAFGRTNNGVTSTPEKYLMSAGTRVPSSMPADHEEIVEPVLPTLYGRDGSPVASQRGGTVDPIRKPTHDLDSQDGSRMYILELYQQAIDDKEALEVEVVALTAALDKANDIIQQNHDRLTEVQGLLEAERAKSMQFEAEGEELASRLTTAQIRRLEAEKLLLEAKLEWNRLQKMMQRQNENSETGMMQGGQR